MTNLFLHLVNMSITAGWIVIAVIVLRLLLRKAPRWMLCLLWGIAGLRLVFPFKIESVLSLIPSNETIPPEIIYSPTPQIHSGINTFNNVVNPIISESFAPEAGASVNPLQIILGIGANLWIAGIIIMLLYTLVSFLRIRRKVRVSLPTEKGVYICDNINTPFILGLFKPKIYLPSTLSTEDINYVLAHERAHIKRKDHLWKPLGFLLLTVYWFNPLLWASYILLCRDIELACDEKVIKETEGFSKKEYSTALLNCSVPRRMISACPLAFGEVGVKQRVKNILNYKKPAFWIICVALIASIVASVCLLTNPVEKNNGNLSAEVTQSGSDIEGVSIEIVDMNLEENLSENSYIEIKWKNKNNESYTCGEPFDVFKKVNGEWVNLRRGDSLFTSIGYMIPKKGDFTHKYTLWNIEIDSPGEYRFTSTFLRDKGDTFPTQYTAWVEFEIDELPYARDYRFAVTKQGTDRYGFNLELVRINTQSSEPFIEIRWNNTLDYDITTTNEYKIYKYENNKWVLLNEGNYVWEEIAHIIPAKGIFTKKFSLKNFDIGTITQNGKFRFECPFASNNEKAWVEFYYPLTKSTVASSYVNSDISGLSVEVQDMTQTLYDGKEYLNDKSKIKIKWTNQSGKKLTTTSDQFIDLYKNVNGIWVDMTLVKNKINPSGTDFEIIEAITLENNTSKTISHTLFGKQYLEYGEYKMAVTFVTESNSHYTANVYFTVGKATTTSTITSTDLRTDCIVYYCNDTPETVTRPELRLYPNESRFELVLSALSSYLPTGTYRYEENKLILEADYGNTYVFKVNVGDTNNVLTDEFGTSHTVKPSSFTFVADESAELPKYKYNANEKAKYPFEEGAVFEIDEDIFVGDPTGYVYDSISYDIDSDGVKENISLTFGPTYGRETVSLVVKEGRRKQSTNTFENYWDDLSFQVKDHRLYFTGTTKDSNPQKAEIEICYEDGIVLREDGFPAGYKFSFPTAQAAKAITNYLEGFRTHNAEMLNSALCEDLRYDPDDTGLIDTFINTVEDCRLISADFDNFNGKEVVVTLTYKLVYNDNYNPVGMREKGTNYITTVFTIKEIQGDFLITDTGIELVQKTI